MIVIVRQHIMKNDSKTKKITIFNTFQKITFIFFLYGMGIVLPLYYNNYYFDMMEAKAYIYQILSIILLILLLVLLLLKIINKVKMIDNNPITISLLLFLITTFVSTIFSYNAKDAFTGFQGWYVGFYTIASLIITILLLKDTNIQNKRIFIPIVIAISIIYLLTITDEFEIDILGFRQELYIKSYHKYLSTIGNINWFVGYLSLTAPFFICLFLKEEKRVASIIYGILSILGISNIALIGADGMYLALGIASFFIIPFIFYDINRIKRFSNILFTFSIFIYISRILNYPMDGYCAYTRELYVIIPCIITSILLFLFSIIEKNNHYYQYRKIIIILLEIVLFVIAIVFTISSIKNADYEWGTGRIMIWKESIDSFKDFSLYNKLFGLGPELLNNVYSSISSSEGAMLLSSHSEPVQILLTMGIFGLLIWFSFWIIIFKSYIKKKVWQNNAQLPFYIAFIAYFGQSLVNSATTTNVANFAILLTLYFISLNNKQNNN